MVGRFVGFVCLLIIAAGLGLSTYLMATDVYTSYVDYGTTAAVGPMIFFCSALISATVGLTYCAFGVLLRGDWLWDNE
jgi:hypothetical protein